MGEKYRRVRAKLMRQNGDGFTKLYGKFNNPENKKYEINELRDMQIGLDVAVLIAYGWEDIRLEHGFHETKTGVRFTISETACRAVLDRLLALNHQRHAEEEAEKAALPVLAPAKRGRKPEDLGGQITIDL